jgi:hypothetical protein
VLHCLKKHHSKPLCRKSSINTGHTSRHYLNFGRQLLRALPGLSCAWSFFS